ncbi:hypothetical protein SDJN03_07713, partial [Cucurbita argyrosperma subsp. sororia]
MFYFKLFVKSPLEAYPRQSQFNFQHLSVSIYIVGRRRLPPQARPWILPRVIAFLSLFLPLPSILWQSQSQIPAIIYLQLNRCVTLSEG